MKDKTALWCCCAYRSSSYSSSGKVHCLLLGIDVLGCIYIVTKHSYVGTFTIFAYHVYAPTTEGEVGLIVCDADSVSVGVSVASVCALSKG